MLIVCLFAYSNLICMDNVDNTNASNAAVNLQIAITALRANSNSLQANDQTSAPIVSNESQSQQSNLTVHPQQDVNNGRPLSPFNTERAKCPRKYCHKTFCGDLALKTHMDTAHKS